MDGWICQRKIKEGKSLLIFYAYNAKRFHYFDSVIDLMPWSPLRPWSYLFSLSHSTMASGLQLMM